MQNAFKQAIQAGRLQLGLWNSICSPVTAEMLAAIGYDWMLFDTEHSPVEVAGVLPLLQAAHGGTAHSLVRPAWNDAVLIKRLLDIGAQTLLVPFIQDADDARNAVSACRYPPQGIRGVAGLTRASAYGRTKDYLKRANEEICLLLQVETRTAIVACHLNGFFLTLCGSFAVSEVVAMGEHANEIEMVARPRGQDSGYCAHR